MRALRFVVLALLAAATFSTVACTNPTGPKPAGDSVANPVI